MWQIAWQLGFFVLLALGILSLRGVRWAYLTFVVLSLLYFPARVGFQLNPHPCALAINIPLAIHSLSNYPHIVLFAMFFVMTSAQLRMSSWRSFLWAALATVVMGALVELGEGISGKGNCRLRDLIPDTVGALIGAGIVLLWNKLRGKPLPSWSSGR